MKAALLGFLTFSLVAGGDPAQLRSTWVLATDSQDRVVPDLKATEWKLKLGGVESPIVKIESPDETSKQFQNWFLIFQPIMDWPIRLNAFQATAQFLANIPEGDRVAIIARTKNGLVPLTPGLTTDRLAWVKALEKLPSQLSNKFDGKDGVLSPELESIKLTNTASPGKPEEFVSTLRAFLARLPKEVREGAYGEAEQKNVRIIDRLGFGNQAEVRGKLSIVANELKSIETVLKSAGRCSGINHCVIFSNSDADAFTHPSISQSMRKSFTRVKGDEGGPSESAELALRDTNITRASVKAVALGSGVTLHSIAGNTVAYGGNLGTVATATGGSRHFFHADMPKKLWESLLAYGSRYRISWNPLAEAGSKKEVSLTTTRPGIQLLYASE